MGKKIDDILKLDRDEPSPEDVSAYFAEKVKLFPIELLLAMYDICRCLRERDGYGNSITVSPRLMALGIAIVQEVDRRKKEAEKQALTDPQDLEWWVR